MPKQRTMNAGNVDGAPKVDPIVKGALVITRSSFRTGASKVTIRTRPQASQHTGTSGEGGLVKPHIFNAKTPPLGPLGV